MFSHLSRKQRLLYWLAGLVLLLSLSNCVSPSHPASSLASPTTTRYKTDSPIRPFIDTWSNIHLFLTFDYGISDPTPIANHYDFVWGADKANVAAFRSGNPNIFITYYVPFHRDSGTFSNPGAYRGLTYWKAAHPDWILYKCDRVTPAYASGDPDIPLDFSNPAVVAWQVQTYAQPASEWGYDGIAADNLNLMNYTRACGVYINGKWVQRYTGQVDDPQWRADIVSWLTRMHQALHQLKHPLALVPNLYLGNISPNDPIVEQVLAHADGVLDEDGFTHSAQGYLTDTGWVQKIQFMEKVQAQGKPYFVINQFPTSFIDKNEIQWALASYLMAKEHSAALFISTYQGYGGDTRYFEYVAQIGHPRGAMYQFQNVYLRKYTNGLSIVNPSAIATYTVNLREEGTFVDLYGHPVSIVIMPPHSGMVLLTSS